MIIERNRALRMCKVHRIPYFRTPLNQLHRRVKAAINEFRNKRWTNFVVTLSMEDNTILEAASRIRSLRTQTHAFRPLIADMKLHKH